MQKIPTLFLRNPDNMGLVTDEINPEAAWVLTEPSLPTIKRDGQNVQVVVSKIAVGLQKRRNPPKKEKKAARAAGLPVPEPTYVWASRDDPEDQYLFRAFDNTRDTAHWPEGEWPCEALGPKIQGNPEGLEDYELYPFSLFPALVLDPYIPWTFDMLDLAEWIEYQNIEGVVWHSQDKTKFAKIKRRDFGLSWPLKEAS